MNARKASRWLKRIFLLAILTGGVAYGARYWKQQQPLAAPTTEYKTVVVSRGDLAQAVTAAGQLNPVVKVEVGSQISGNILKLLVDFNSTVKDGQVIAKLDPATYEANLLQAEGNLASAKAALEYAQLNAARAKSLQADKLNTKADYEKATADLHQAEANVKINEAAVKKAQVDLERCTIYAPIDGMVISRDVNVGQTVAASLSAPKLFVIGNDLTKMQIEARVPEADIGGIETGQPVTFTVDAFPGTTFQGKVVQVRNAPIVEQNVVTYETIIAVENPGLKLKPGMTANASVIIAKRDNALKIPNAALRFKPPKAGEAKSTDLASLSSDPDSKPEKESKPDKKSSGSRKSKDKEKKKSEHTVYLLLDPADPDGGLLPLSIKTGITDGSFTEVLDGLNDGDKVLTSMTLPKPKGSDLDGLVGGLSGRVTELAGLFTGHKK